MESMATLKERAEHAERQAKLLEGALIASEAHEVELKSELQASWDAKGLRLN